jgi:hemerythrin-like domain-containing protein
MKRLPELRDLSDDHHQGLVLARKAKRAAADQISISETWRDVELAFKNELAIHFQIEEEYLVGPMQKAGQTLLSEQLIEEHRQIRALVSPGAPKTDQTLEQFGLLLENHIRFEERKFFETAQQVLDTNTLTAVAQACKQRNA